MNPYHAKTHERQKSPDLSSSYPLDFGDLEYTLISLQGLLALSASEFWRQVQASAHVFHAYFEQCLKPIEIYADEPVSRMKLINSVLTETMLLFIRLSLGSDKDSQPKEKSTGIDFKAFEEDFEFEEAKLFVEETVDEQQSYRFDFTETEVRNFERLYTKENPDLAKMTLLKLGYEPRVVEDEKGVVGYTNLGSHANAVTYRPLKREDETLDSHKVLLTQTQLLRLQEESDDEDGAPEAEPSFLTPHLAVLTSVKAPKDMTLDTLFSKKQRKHPLRVMVAERTGLTHEQVEGWFRYKPKDKPRDDLLLFRGNRGVREDDTIPENDVSEKPEEPPAPTGSRPPHKTANRQNHYRKDRSLRKLNNSIR